MNQTRRPKEHEVDGKDYFFTKRSQMEADIRDQKFLESSEVLSTSGESNIYGTSLTTVREVAATGQLCVMGMDIQVLA